MKSSSAMYIIGLVIGLFIILMIGSQMYQYLSSSYRTETAYLSVGTDSETVQGVFIRDEEVLTYDGSGVISYSVSDGAKLGIGSEIACIYATEKQIETQQRIASLEESLSLLERISNPGTLETAQPSNLSSLFTENYKSFLYQREQGNLSSIAEEREEMLVLLSTYQLVTGSDTDYSDKIASIESEIQALKLTTEAPIDTITAERSAYFVSYADGYESSLTLDAIDSLTAEDILAVTDTGKYDGNAIGKLIDGYTWVLAAVVDNSLKEYEVGNTVTLKFSSTSTTVTGEISSLDASSGSDQTVIVITCETLTYDLVQHRVDTVEIIRAEYSGIQVPRSALRFAELTEDICDEDGEVIGQETISYRGVYILNGEQAEFRKLDVIYEGSDYVISAQISDSEYLQLYDSIITKGVDADGS